MNYGIYELKLKYKEYKNLGDINLRERKSRDGIVRDSENE